jgi:catechol 2,3-dioxygenase-like lactoylglutathione lyase family enzyme
MVENVIHTSFWVSDMDRTESFYIDVLGLSRTREHGGSTYQPDVKNVFVAGPDGTELQFKHRPDREPEEPAGFDHVALSTTDIDAEFDRIVEDGTHHQIARGVRIAVGDEPLEALEFDTFHGTW